MGIGNQDDVEEDFFMFNVLKTNVKIEEESVFLVIINFCRKII